MVFKKKFVLFKKSRGIVKIPRVSGYTSKNHIVPTQIRLTSLRWVNPIKS